MNLFFSEANKPVWFDPNKQVIFDPVYKDSEWGQGRWTLYVPFTFRRP